MISKCGQYIETALKWLGTQEPQQSTRHDLATLHTIVLANLWYLQGEYQVLLVNSQFDNSTVQISRVFQDGEYAGFDDNPHANLRAAVEITALRGRLQYTNQRRGNFSAIGRGYRGGGNYSKFGNRDVFHNYAQCSVNTNHNATITQNDTTTR